MKNMAEVLKALLDGKKLVNSSLPGCLYICIENNVLCGSSIDDDYKEESLQPLQNNIYLINNPECYSLYFPYNVGDILFLIKKDMTVKIVAITDNNVYFENVYSETEGTGYSLNRSDFLNEVTF